MPNFSYESRLWNDFHLVAGVDEAGRGPLAGPVVASAVIFDKSIIINSQIDDSKKISEHKRNELADWIMNNALSVGIGIVDVEEIEKINILNASMKAMAIAIDNLKYKPEFLLIDGNRFIDIGINYQTIIKGDSVSYSISSASIMAKTTRDKIMLDYATKFPNYGFEHHKGYATKSHFKEIELFGITEIHRPTFLRKFFSKQQSLF